MFNFMLQERKRRKRQWPLKGGSSNKWAKRKTILNECPRFFSVRNLTWAQGLESTQIPSLVGAEKAGTSSWSESEWVHTMWTRSWVGWRNCKNWNKQFYMRGKIFQCLNSCSSEADVRENAEAVTYTHKQWCFCGKSIELKSCKMFWNLKKWDQNTPCFLLKQVFRVWGWLSFIGSLLILFQSFLKTFQIQNNVIFTLNQTF